MLWAIFAHDPDGDMGDGRILGGYRTPEGAEKKAEDIRMEAERRGKYVECIILPQRAASAAAGRIVEEVAACG